MKLRELADKKLEDFTDGRKEFDLDAIDMPVEAAGLKEWEEMEPERKSRILGGMLRNLVRRTLEHVPLYRDNGVWKDVRPDEIREIGDLVKLPILSKDSVAGTGSPHQTGIIGFRSKVIKNPHILVPDNLEEVLGRQERANPNYEEILKKFGGNRYLTFGSGGSLGKSTKTILSYLTIEMEAYALSRVLALNGFEEGQRIACFYAPDHKGGLQLERAAEIMEMEFHSKNRVFGSLANDQRYKEAVEGFKEALTSGNMKRLEEVAPKVRAGIREYIREHQIQVIESVQPPAKFASKNAKGNSLAFMTIYLEDPSAFSSVEHVFLTGFPVPKEAYERLREEGKEVSTTWGSTETMALGTYVKGCESANVNHLLAIGFPTVGMVARYRERDVDLPRLEEVEVGRDGLLLVTSLIGGGSTYFNYLIGDLCINNGRGYTDINRAAAELNIAGSCAADALSL